MNAHESQLRVLRQEDDSSETETKPEQSKAMEVALQQIDAAAEMIQSKLERAQIERGSLTKALNFLKEKLLRRESADQILTNQLDHLQELRQQVMQDPKQAERALELVQKQHGGELLLAAKPAEEIDADINLRAKQAVEAASKTGRVLFEENVVHDLTLQRETEDQLMREFFAEGDAMSGAVEDHYNREKTDEAARTKAYKEQYVKNTAETWEDRLNGELDLNDQFVRDAVVKKELIYNNQDTRVIFKPTELTQTNRMIRDWFDEGSHRDILLQRQAEELQASEMYKKEITQATKSTKAQTMAFELFLSGRMALNKFTKTLEKIRKDLGPGLMVDYATRVGVEHDMASHRIFDQLAKREPVLRGYQRDDVVFYRTSQDKETKLIVTLPGRSPLQLSQEQWAGAGLFKEDVEAILAVSPEESDAYIGQASEKHRVSSKRFFERMTEVDPRLQRFDFAQLQFSRIDNDRGPSVAIIIPNSTPIVFSPEQLAQAGIGPRDIQDITHASPTELAQFVSAALKVSSTEQRAAA